MDPGLKLFAPVASDFRIRMVVNDKVSVTQAIKLTVALRARGFGVDLLATLGQAPAAELLAVMKTDAAAA
jgi:hypothetical protein